MEKLTTEQLMSGCFEKAAMNIGSALGVPGHLLKPVCTDKEVARSKALLSPEDAFFFAIGYSQRFAEGEVLIATNAYYSVRYAIDVLHGQFKMGEEAISKSPTEAFWYARDIIKKRWRKGEKAIATSSYYSYEYACTILKGERVKIIDKAILSDEDYRQRYLNILQEWKEHLRPKVGLHLGRVLDTRQPYIESKWMQEHSQYGLDGGPVRTTEGGVRFIRDKRLNQYLPHELIGRVLEF